MSGKSKATASSSAKQRKTPKKWDYDGVGDGPSSMDIILDWVTSGANYARWRGDAHGISKQTLCEEIAGLMREAGILHLNAADVRAKILNLQASYNKARDWSENTEEGIRAAGGDDAEETIHGMIRALIYNKCLACWISSSSSRSTCSLSSSKDRSSSEEV